MFRRESIVTGFGVALGVAGCLLCLYLSWRLLGAVSAIIAPFIGALVLALILDPVVDRLEDRLPGTQGNRRLWAVVIVYLGLLLLLAGLLAFIVPNLIAQSTRLITFFAPLSYRIDRTREDGRFVIVEREYPGTQFVVRRLRNGQRYRFRVIAQDSEGKRYSLQEAEAIPRSVSETRQVFRSNGPREADNERNVTVPEPDEGNFGADTPILPTPRPTPTPATGGLFAPFTTPSSVPVSPTVTPESEVLAEPEPFEEPVDSDTATGTATPVVSEAVAEDLSPAESPSPVAEATASPSVSPTPAPLGAPSPTLSPIPARSPVPSATATPRSLIPVAGKTPSLLPSATPSPVAKNGTKTPSSASRKSSPSADEAVTGRNSRDRVTLTANPAPVPSPGTVAATPGDSAVRLVWRPPVTAASGFDRLRTQADRWLLEHRSIGPVKLPRNLAAIQAQYSDQLSQVVRQVTQRAADIVVGSVSAAMTVMFALIIGFYMLVDFDRLRMRFLYLMPSQARGGVVRSLGMVGGIFDKYVRGMATVATAYGLVSIVVFFGMGSIFDIGLKGYALLLGVIAGVLYPVPFLGPLVTTGVIGAVSLATGATPVQAIIAVVVVQVQNAIFDNGVTPRVVGESVGLHPLVTIFALFLGGNLFGLVGMLLAVPVAASIQRLLILQYPRLGEPTGLSVRNPDLEERLRSSAESAPPSP
ncbi:MAG: AI-2E family transporter [Capsulimonadales bacterium]|nr:AI-2E family transporter [Capsulimonadales bacterium]